VTGTTGKGRFAPFETTISWFYPGVLLSLFILADPEFLDKEGLVKGMSRIGKFGFGRDASTGMGRFTILDTCPLPLPDLSAGDALYTLAPCLPEKDRFNQTWFTPFVRFGKHGDLLAGVRQPFKNPVIMADEGAVCIPAQNIETPYIGCAVTNVSKAMPETVVQAYAPVLPIRLGGHHEKNL
jgi:CRISPR-associated protein Csm4